MPKSLKVLLLFDSPYQKPLGYDYKEEFKSGDWETESDVYKALCANGHSVRLLGLYNDILSLVQEVVLEKPDIIFNLAEVFNQKSQLEKNIVCLIEMLDFIHTGANSSSLFVCNNKALTKEILTYHRIKVPKFHTFYRGRRIHVPKKLRLPLVVKPLSEEASRGISQASVTDNEEALIERVQFIHETIGVDAIAEEYIDGREFYVGVMGNKRISVFPPTEIKFGNMPEDEPRIATYKAKWDNDYRKRWGIKNVFPGRLPSGFEEKIKDTCKRAYRDLNLRCYARFDIRVTPDGHVYIIEVNANPCLAKEEDFSMAAEKEGLPYTVLIQKIIELAFKRTE